MGDGKHGVDVILCDFQVLTMLRQSDVNDTLGMIRCKETGKALLGFQDARGRIQIVESHHGLHLRRLLLEGDGEELMTI